jgi:hypothetical protein
MPTSRKFALLEIFHEMMQRWDQASDAERKGMEAELSSIFTELIGLLRAEREPKE